jgi:hypothetical protein
MDIKELLDDGNIDPKKFFDEKEYVTLLLNRDGFTKKQNATADLIHALLEKELTREEQEEIFSQLKLADARNYLLEAIGNTPKSADKARLCAACWESGLDFTEHFLFFARLVCQEDFTLAMEAFTVVENLDGVVAEKDLLAAMELAQNYKQTSHGFVQALLENIRERNV